VLPPLEFIQAHQRMSPDAPGYRRGSLVKAMIAYVDGPHLARRFGHSSIGSLAFICPACVVALAHERWPRWVPPPEFQTDVRPCGATTIYGVSRDLDRSITPSPCHLARSVIGSARERAIGLSGSSCRAEDLSGPARTNSNALRCIALARHHEFPGDPGDLVGQGDRGQLWRLALEQLQQPGRGSRTLAAP
jgi:hypothetical protein